MTEANPDDHVRALSPDRFTETDWDWDTAMTVAARACSDYDALGAAG